MSTKNSLGNDRGVTSQPAMKEMGEAAGNVKQSLKDMGNLAGQAVHEKSEELRDAAMHYYERGRDKAVKYEKSLESQIREKPLQAVLIALGVGCTLGFIWSRR